MKCKKNVVKLLCMLMVFVIAAGTIWDFSLQLQRALTQETYRTLSEVSKDYNKAFSDRILYNIKTMNVLAGGLKEMKGREKQDVMRILQNAVDDGGFARVVVCDANGISCANDGTSRDISNYDFFQKVIRGEVHIGKLVASVVNGEESIIVAVPIYGEKAVEGVLFGVHPLSVASAQLLDFTYYSEGYGFITDPDGTILLSSEHTDKLADEKNLFAFFEKTKLIDFSIAELKTVIANGESTSFAFSYHGARRFVSVTPSPVDDWVTFSIASDALMLQQEKITSQIVLQLLLKLAVAGAFLFAWIFLENRHHNKEILKASQQYQSLLAHINGGMIVAIHGKTADETITTYVSAGFTDMTGYTLEDIRTMYGGRYLNVLFEKDRKAVFEKYLEQLAVGNTYRMPYRIQKKDGSLLWVMDNGYLVKDADGLHNHSIITDITAVKAQEEELRSSENRFSIAINASSGALFEVDLQKQLYTHFENAERIFGISAEKLLQDTRAFSDLPFDEFTDAVTDYFFHPDDRVLARMGMEKLTAIKTASYEARLRRADGSYIWARIDLSLSLDEFGKPSRLVGFMSDIDDIKKQAELLESKVKTDPMTGLYNKIAMATLANKIVQDDSAGRHALIVLDVDNFKGVNDTLGHAFGDVVLIETAAKLKGVFRDTDLVGRMGGDEFAILMKNVLDSNHVLKKAAELSGTLRQTYTGKKDDYKISCSIGVMMIQTNQDTFETLYRKADAALYQAKRNGKDQVVLYQEQEAGSYPVETARTNDEELQNLKAYHNTEDYIFELLYASKDFDISINRALAMIGQEYHVSRAYIFENDETTHSTSNIYEWCNDGVPSEIDNLKNLELSSGVGNILECYDRNGLLYCNDIRELPPYPRSILEAQGVMSTLQMTISDDEKIYGLIGFDECKEYRIWKAEEIEKMSFLAKVLSVFLFKEKAKATVLANLNTRLKILDILPDCICVVNPQTHALVYANMKMQELLPAVRPGAFCFSALHGGQNAPCSTCLMERIRRGDTDNLEIINEDQSVRIQVSALIINWSDDQKMVLLYGTEQRK